MPLTFWPSSTTSVLAHNEAADCAAGAAPRAGGGGGAAPGGKALERIEYFPGGRPAKKKSPSAVVRVTRKVSIAKPPASFEIRLTGEIGATPPSGRSSCPAIRAVGTSDT